MGKPEKCFKNIDEMVRLVNLICAIGGASCIMFLMFWGMIAIAVHFVFKFELPGQYEGSVLLLTLIVYLSIGFTQYQKAHVAMTLVVSRMKGTARQLIDFLGLAVCLTVSVIFLWRTGIEFFKTFTTAQFQMGLYSFPLWPSKLALPVGFLLLSLCLIVQITSCLIRLMSSKDVESIDGRKV
jgi:TRAP-type C4-dicarboxylate transport system permease small subunit